MSKELVGRFAAAAAVGAMALSLAACESAADIEAKPDLAATLHRVSIEVCDPQYSPADHNSYSERLMGVFMNTDTAALRYLQDHGITVCLDKRLDQEHYGFFERTVRGVYYPDTEVGRVLTIGDNGQHIKDFGFFEMSVATKGPQALEKLPSAFGGWFDKYESIDQAVLPQKAHSRSCGKSCTTTGWSDFDNIAEHPALLHPPIIAP